MKFSIVVFSAYLQGQCRRRHADSGSPETAAHSRSGWSSSVCSRTAHKCTDGYGGIRCHYHLLVCLQAKSPQTTMWSGHAVGGNTSKRFVYIQMFSTVLGKKMSFFSPTFLWCFLLNGITDAWFKPGLWTSSVWNVKRRVFRTTPS